RVAPRLLECACPRGAAAREESAGLPGGWAPEVRLETRGRPTRHGAEKRQNCGWAALLARGPGKGQALRWSAGAPARIPTRAARDVAVSARVWPPRPEGMPEPGRCRFAASARRRSPRPARASQPGRAAP